MSKILAIVMIYLSSLLLSVSCGVGKIETKEFKSTGNDTQDMACTQRLISDLGYTQEQFTERVMECNILKLESQDARIRRYKGQRRVEIVYLNVKCDEISRVISQYNTECKNDLTVTKF